MNRGHGFSFPYVHQPSPGLEQKEGSELADERYRKGSEGFKSTAIVHLAVTGNFMQDLHAHKPCFLSLFIWLGQASVATCRIFAS